MTTWVVVELPKGGESMAVHTHKNLSDARDDFLDRYNDIKSKQSVLVFELDKDGEGFFEAEGTSVWLCEASPAEMLV